MESAKRLRMGGSILSAAAGTAFLYWIGHHNYLLFHTLTELFSIGVAFAIFLIAWNSRQFTKQNYLLFVGLSFVFIGLLDLIHTAVYKGMGVFVNQSPDQATQVWITARYLQGATFVLAGLLINRRIHPGLLIGVFTGLTTLVLLSIFTWHIFPDCFIEGDGLTAFKKVSEFIISGLFAVSIGLLIFRRHYFSRLVFIYLCAGIGLSILSELCFILYSNPYGPANMAGHFFKVYSFFLIYKALVETQLIDPYSTLFRDLQQKEAVLRGEWKQREMILNAIPDGIYIVNRDYTIEYINPAMEQMFGPVEGQLCHEYLHCQGSPCDECGFNNILTGQIIRRQFTMKRNGRVYDTLETPFTNPKTGDACKLKIMRDMTEIETAHEAIKNIARFPSENPYPVMRVSRDGVILYANSACNKLMQSWGREEKGLVPNAWYAVIQRAMESEHMAIYEESVQDDIVSFAIVPVKEDRYVNIYGRDITEYRTIQKNLRRINEQLEKRVQERTEQLNNTVETLQAEVAERIEAEKKLILHQQRLRSLSLELIYAEEQERREIATQLHDSVGPVLAFARRELGILNQQAQEELKGPMLFISELLRQAVEQTRTLTFDLSSATLYMLGFEAAVEEMAEEFAQKEKFTCDVLNGQELGPMDQQTQIMLFRSVRELLMNVAKHSRAQHVQVEMKREANAIHITVRDDGVGFDPEQVHSEQGYMKGYGLFSLQERLANLGGSVEIQSVYGQGTTVTLTAPVENGSKD